jgi:AGCS family alanine or glycine:cation symporter
LSAAIIFGGAASITRLAGKVVPLIAIFYIGIGVVVFLTNLSFVPEFFVTIFSQAFRPTSAIGGTVAFTIMAGLKRGIFSNEAGLGSGAHSAAVTDSEHPTEQGYLQAFGVYLTTLVVTTITAFLILVTDAPNMVATAGNGIELTGFAMTTLFGDLGAYLLTVAIFFFGFTTIPTAYFYGESNLRFLSQKKLPVLILRCCVLAVVFFSTIISPRVIFSLVDIGTGITAIINLIALQLLLPQVKKQLKKRQKASVKRKFSATT